MTIKLDLTRDLDKVNLKHAAASQGCLYTAPCAVGAMMTEEERQQLADAGLDSRSVLHCIILGKIDAPTEQHRDLDALQTAFDSHDDQFFVETLADLKEKYLA